MVNVIIRHKFIHTFWNGEATEQMRTEAEKLFCRQGDMMVTWAGMVGTEMEKSR